MRAFASVLSAAPIAIVLSIIVWVVMYYAFPDAPLTAAETALLVFVFTALAAMIRGFIKRDDRSGGEKSDESS